MKYNTSEDALIIPEYGRNVQRLINHAKTIEDKEYRQEFVEKVVQLMAQMNPQTKTVEDYLTKIWGHVFVIADFDLDVDAPEGVSREREALYKRPAQIPYPQIKSKFRHYGKNVHTMIDKAVAMEDEEKKKEFAHVIASYMKMAFKTWNREVVSDEQIASDLSNLSDGALEISENANIDGLIQQTRNKRPKKSNNNKSGSHSGKRHYKSSNRNRKRY